jgi:hypothetical protein
MGKRDQFWCTPQEAANLVREDSLMLLLHGFVPDETPAFS